MYKYHRCREEKSKKERDKKIRLKYFYEKLGVVRKLCYNVKKIIKNNYFFSELIKNN